VLCSLLPHLSGKRVLQEVPMSQRARLSVGMLVTNTSVGPVHMAGEKQAKSNRQ
jgi:hypothetical protein